MPYWNEEAIIQYIKKWNDDEAPKYNPILEPVHFEDFPFLHAFGKFQYSKTTRCFSQDHFCTYHGITVENHIDKVNSIAKSEGYAIYFLDDVIMEDLPINQVELFFSLIGQRHILLKSKSYMSPGSAKSSLWK